MEGIEQMALLDLTTCKILQMPHVIRFGDQHYQHLNPMAIGEEIYKSITMVGLQIS
jgi:hypothetical protein